MQLKLRYGQEELFSELPQCGSANVRKALMSIATSRPEIFQRLCNRDGLLRESLAVFVNGDHIRYHDGLETALEEEDEIYIVPLITGG
jgi:molybdopterin synthase sulfur carrier subunit